MLKLFTSAALIAYAKSANLDDFLEVDELDTDFARHLATANQTSTTTKNETKTDEPKKEEPKKNETKTEEPTKEEPKKEEPKSNSTNATTTTTPKKESAAVTAATKELKEKVAIKRAAEAKVTATITAMVKDVNFVNMLKAVVPSANATKAQKEELQTAKDTLLLAYTQKFAPVIKMSITPASGDVAASGNCAKYTILAANANSMSALMNILKTYVPPKQVDMTVGNKAASQKADDAFRAEFRAALEGVACRAAAAKAGRQLRQLAAVAVTNVEVSTGLVEKDVVLAAGAPAVAAVTVDTAALAKAQTALAAVVTKAVKSGALPKTAQAAFDTAAKEVAKTTTVIVADQKKLETADADVKKADNKLKAAQAPTKPAATSTSSASGLNTSVFSVMLLFFISKLF